MASLSGTTSHDDESQSIFESLGKSGPITPVPVEVATQYWNTQNKSTKEIDFPPQNIPGFDFTKDGKGTFEDGSKRGTYEFNASEGVRKCDWEETGPGGSITYRGVEDVEHPPFKLGQRNYYDVPKDGIGLRWTTFRAPETESRSVLVCNSRSLLTTGASLAQLGLETPSTPVLPGHGGVSLHQLPMDYSQAPKYATSARHPRDAPPMPEKGVVLYQDDEGRDVLYKSTETGTSGHVYNQNGSLAGAWDDYLGKTADGRETPCTRSVWYDEHVKQMFIQTKAWSKDEQVATAIDMGTF